MSKSKSKRVQAQATENPSQKHVDGVYNEFGKI